MSYNGWSNRATWNVSLWLNNDEGLYNELQALVRRNHNRDSLAQQIEELCRALWPNGTTPDDDKLDEADFGEIADAELSDVEDEEEKEKPSSLSAFAVKHALRFNAHRVNARPDGLMQDAKNPMRHFRCIIMNESNAKSMTLYFSQGSAHVAPPTLTDVLNCIASDASSYDDAGSFEDWADELGYDTDSRTAEKTYKAVKRQAEQIKRILGPEGYKELLETERD